MLKKMYSVYDSKSEIFSSPFTSVNDSTAVRDFSRAVNDEQTDINRFPLDYSLFTLGTFDDTSGVITPASPPAVLVQAASLVNNNL